MKLILLSALFLLPLPLSGQEIAKSGNSSIKIRMLAMEVPPELGKVYLISDDVRSSEFDIPINNVSELLKVSRRILTLKTSKKDAVLCNIMLPEEGKRFVRDGGIWTSGGVFSGVDLALAYIDSFSDTAAPDGSSRRGDAGKVQLFAEYISERRVYSPNIDLSKAPAHIRLAFS